MTKKPKRPIDPGTGKPRRLNAKSVLIPSVITQAQKDKIKKQRKDSK